MQVKALFPLAIHARHCEVIYAPFMVAFYSWMINFLDPFTSQNCNFIPLSPASA